MKDLPRALFNKASNDRKIQDFPFWDSPTKAVTLSNRKSRFLTSWKLRILALRSTRDLHDVHRRGRLVQFSLLKGIHVEPQNYGLVVQFILPEQLVVRSQVFGPPFLGIRIVRPPEGNSPRLQFDTNITIIRLSPSHYFFLGQ